jgi:nucleoside-diphosphate-sugar epimerase
MKELAERMFEVAHWHPKELDIKNGQAGSVKRRLADTTKLRALVGWTPEMSLNEGLKTTYDWYVAHPDPKG